MIDGRAVGPVEIERHDAAAAIRRGRAVEPRQRPAVGLFQREQLIQQPAREAADALVNRVDADRLDMREADLNRRHRKKIECAVFECRRPVGEVVLVALHGCDRDRPA